MATEVVDNVQPNSLAVGLPAGGGSASGGEIIANLNRREVVEHLALPDLSVAINGDGHDPAVAIHRNHVPGNPSDGSDHRQVEMRL